MQQKKKCTRKRIWEIKWNGRINRMAKWKVVSACVCEHLKKKNYIRHRVRERERAWRRRRKKIMQKLVTHTYTHYKIDKYGKPNYNSILVSIFNFHPILRHVQCRPEWQSEFVRKRWFQMMNANEFTVDPEDVCMK